MFMFRMQLGCVYHSMWLVVWLVLIMQSFLHFHRQTSTIMQFPRKERHCLLVSEIIRSEFGIPRSPGMGWGGEKTHGSHSVITPCQPNAKTQTNIQNVP